MISAKKIPKKPKTLAHSKAAPSSQSKKSSLAEKARERLEQDCLFRGRTQQIRIEDHDGDLVLRGQLPSFYLKQVLQATIGKLEGVKSIDNRVDILWPDERQ